LSHVKILGENERHMIRLTFQIILGLAVNIKADMLIAGGVRDLGSKVVSRNAQES
jgi:hypothetical protein